MRAWFVPLRLARAVAVVALLLAAGWQTHVRHVRTAVHGPTDVWGPWLVGSLACAVVVAVILVGRRTLHPWAVLAVEAVLAAVLAVVPPLQWLLWSGITWWTEALTSGVVQPLAIAWLGVVIATAVHQLRRPARRPREDVRGQASGSFAPPASR